jgi:hypothetical protein
MPAAISALRTGIADALNSLLGIRVYNDIPDTPVTPCAITELQRVTYDTTMARGADEYQFSVQVLSGRADDRTAQARIEAYVAGSGTESLKTALEADPTLGGSCMTVRVIEAGGLQTYDRSDGMSLLGVEFQVLIYA